MVVEEVGVMRLGKKVATPLDPVEVAGVCVRYDKMGLFLVSNWIERTSNEFLERNKCEILQVLGYD